MRLISFLALLCTSFEALSSDTKYNLWNAAIHGGISNFSVEQAIDSAPYLYRYPKSDIAEEAITSYIVRNFDSIDPQRESDGYDYLYNFTGYIKDFSISFKIPEGQFLNIITSDISHINTIDSEIDNEGDQAQKDKLIELSGTLANISKQRNEWRTAFLAYLQEKQNPYNTIDKLIDDGHYKQAEQMAEIISDKNSKAALMTRIYLHKPQKKLKQYVSFINDSNIMTEGIMIDMAQIYHKSKKFDSLENVIYSMPYAQERPEYFWKFTHATLHDLLAARRYAAAYELLDRVSLNRFHHEYERKETLAGIVALKFLKKPELAMPHFHNVYNAAVNPEKRSQGAYYIGITNMHLKKEHEAQYWLTLAARNPATFYGQRAVDIINNITPVTFVGFEKYTRKRMESALTKQNSIYRKYYTAMFEDNYLRSKSQDKEAMTRLLQENDLFAIAMNLKKTDTANAKLFLSKSPRMVENLYDENIIIETACTEFDSHTCSDSKEQAKAVGFYPIDTFFRMETIEKNVAKEHFSLIHAIVKRESKFKVQSKSGAGAVGLMQIMPNTAQFISGKMGRKFDKKLFKNNGAYNIALGDWYIFYLLEQFAGSYPLALAAYNGGSGNVSAWKEDYFNPQTYEDMTMFVELIPFKETRDYVKRVVEWEGIYRYLFDTSDISDIS